MKINSLKAKELDRRFADGEDISDYLDLPDTRTRAETGEWDQRMEIQAVGAVLASKPRIQIAILFGSLAVGQAGPGNDIDIAVAASQPLGTDEKIDLIEALRASEIINYPIMRRISAQIQGADKGAYH